jgi:hypothetical protein
MAGNRRMKQEEQLMLTFSEMSNRRQQEGNVTLLLTFHLCRRMLAGSRQMRTVIGTRDLDKSLRGATHRAYRLAQGRTRATSFALSAGRAGHTPASHTLRRISATAVASRQLGMCRFSDIVLKYKRKTSTRGSCHRCSRLPAVTPWLKSGLIE